MPTRPQMEIFAKRWGPFGSIASLYMLRVADNVNAVFLLLCDWSMLVQALQTLPSERSDVFRLVFPATVLARRPD